MARVAPGAYGEGLRVTPLTDVTCQTKAEAKAGRSVAAGVMPGAWQVARCLKRCRLECGASSISGRSAGCLQGSGNSVCRLQVVLGQYGKCESSDRFLNRSGGCPGSHRLPVRWFGSDAPSELRSEERNSLGSCWTTDTRRVPRVRRVSDAVFECTVH